MTRPRHIGHDCRIGLAGRRAATVERRVRGRLAAARPDRRRERALPPLAARLLVRHRRRPAPVAWATRTELRLAPVTILLSGDVAPPAAEVISPAPSTPPAPVLVPGVPAAPAAGDRAPTPPATLELRFVRETVRERIERTVQRVAAMGLRAEPQRANAAAPIAAPVRAAAPATSAPVFPTLTLPRPAAPAAPAAPVAAGGEAADPPAAREHAPARRPSDDAAQREPLPQPHQMPQLVDAIVGELDRRVRAQRERQGWLG